MIDIHKILFFEWLCFYLYFPISIAALVQKVEWKPIYHTAGKKIKGIG